MRGNRPDGRNAEGRTELTTIYWRDIPAQVTARAGRRKASVQLPDRFQTAIDQAATRAGKTDTDDYLAEWRKERKGCGEDLESEATEAAALLEAAFSEEILRRYVRNDGRTP